MGGDPPELDQARFLLVQRQTKLSEAFPEIGPHPPCITFVLKAHHEVVAIPYDDDGPVALRRRHCWIQRSK